MPNFNSFLLYKVIRNCLKPSHTPPFKLTGQTCTGYSMIKQSKALNLQPPPHPGREWTTLDAGLPDDSQLLCYLFCAFLEVPGWQGYGSTRTTRRL